MVQLAAGGFALVNHLVSRSTTRARSPAFPPLHGGCDLLDIVIDRANQGVAIEYLKEQPDVDDRNRTNINQGKTYWRLSDFHIKNDPDWKYYTILIEFFDEQEKSFSVVDGQTYKGRWIEGGSGERGARTAHLTVRFPNSPSARDVSRYRCVVQAVQGISRTAIEHLLCRQIRRARTVYEWTFPHTKVKRGVQKTKNYSYTPRLELHADVRRTVGGSGLVSAIDSMVFTKREELVSTGEAISVDLTDFRADVSIKVDAKHGPRDANKLREFFSGLRELYEKRGYKVEVAFRRPSGDLMSGTLHPDIAGASDLLLCKREPLNLTKPVKRWVGMVDTDMEAALIELVQRDELW